MNVFETFAKLSLDSTQYDEALEDAGRRGSSFASTLGRGLATGVGVAVGAAATGVSLLTREAVSAYGDFEQLVGGVETLFGAGGMSLEEYADSVGLSVDEASTQYERLMNAQTLMLENADQAYLTAGLSANDYMETVTGFSAALINSLGGDTITAAEMADQAIIDMSDNANKMGTDMESIISAYAGFSRGQYQLLDNLKLGYGGTATEMQRLITDAEELSDWWTATRDENGDLTMSYADVVEAIHIVQENMGIAGTTAREANSTIQGSLSAMGGAWTNLVAGLANPDADLGLLIEQMVQTATVAMANLVPAIVTALESIGEALPMVADVIVEYLPQLIDTLLPVVVDVALALINGLVDALPGIMETVIAVLPELIDGVVNAIIALLPLVIEVGIQFLSVLGKALIDNLPTLLPQVTQLITSIAIELTKPDNISSMINSAILIIKAVQKGMMDSMPYILSAVGEIILNILQGLGESLPNVLDFILEKVTTGMDAVFGFIGDILGRIGSIFGTTFESIQGIVSGVIGLIVSLFSGDLSGVVDSVTGILDDVFGLFDGIMDDVLGLVGDAVERLLQAFNFNWELPHLNLPHISVSGGQAPYGIAGQGSLPSFSIEWYRKAYDDAYILNDATIFGASNGKYLGGGEGNGSEAIVGTELLMNMVDQVVKRNISGLRLNVVMDSGELVGVIAPLMDDELGRLAAMESRGSY